MTDATDYTIAAQTEQGAVLIAEVTHTDLTEGDTTNHGAIEHVDPNAIEVETNVRTIVSVDATLVSSIREFGVLEPVVCRRSEDGTVIVRMGQRRVLAARKAERATIPAYIVEGDDTTVTRLVEQFAENEHRAGLTEPERAAVFHQLAFEGLNVAQIAKQTGVKKSIVAAGITVAESEFAGKIVATKHAVTLDQAAALIEFEGDKLSVARLVQCAEEAPEQFAHELQRQRDQRARDEAVEYERTSLTEAGFTILESRPDSYYDKEHISIRDLVTAEGEPVTIEHLAEVTLKFAHVRSYYTGDIDVAYFITDPKALGFKKVSGGNTSGGMTEEQKAERRTLIANNKAWDSAEVVRREWLAAFLSRKTLPKDATAFVAVGLTRHRGDLSSALTTGNRLACQLLDLPAAEGYYFASPLDGYAEQPGKALHAILAVVLAGMEAATGRHTWRNPTSTAVRYFGQLAAWGYPLSEVEQIVTAAKAAAGGEVEADEDSAEDTDS